MRAFMTIFQFYYPVTADNLSLRKLLPADTSQAGICLLLQSVPVCCGAFFTMKRSEKTCRSGFYSCRRITDFDEVQTGISVLATVRPRVSCVAVYAPVTCGSKNQLVKSSSKSISSVGSVSI